MRLALVAVLAIAGSAEAAPKPKAVAPLARNTRPALPPPTSRVPDADKLEADGDRTGDLASYAACGQAYLDAYNKNPEAPDNDEILYRGAHCYTKAQMVSPSVIMLNLLAKYYPASPFAPPTLLQVGYLYASLLFYDRAAQKLETYAKRYAGEPDAFAALRDAASYRIWLGDRDDAIEDTALLAATFATDQPRAVALEVFALTPLFERGKPDELVAHLRAYIATYGAIGGGDLLVRAQAELGATLWHEACATAEVDELCVSVTREHPLIVLPRPATTSGGCGPPTHATLVVHARDAAKVADALAAFADARREHDKHGKAGGDPAELEASALAARLEADHDLEAYLAQAAPADLDRDLDGWVRARSKAGAVLADAYRAIAAVNTSSTLAALARVGQIQEALADQLFTTPVAASGRDAVCRRVGAAADPLDAAAIRAFEACVTRAVDGQLADAWSALCRGELGQLDPAAHDTLTEVIPRAILPATSLDLEAPELPTAPGTDVAARAFTAAERAGWTEPTCRAVAKQFLELVATHGDLPELPYMAGLAFHRCNLAADAGAAYRVATQTKSITVALAKAMSNLAALDAAAGKPELARKGWDDALKANGKLIAARRNLASAELLEMHGLAPSTAAWKRLDDDARFHLANVFAVDTPNVETFTLAAEVWMEGSELAPARLDVAGRLLDQGRARGDKDARLRTAIGIYELRRGSPAAALAKFRAATDSDPSLAVAQVDLGLVALAVHQGALAKDRFAAAIALGSPGYDAILGLAIALRATGDLDGAEREARRAATLEPSRGESWFALAVIHVVRARRATDARVVPPMLRNARAELDHVLASTIDLAAQARARRGMADCDEALARLVP